MQRVFSKVVPLNNLCFSLPSRGFITRFFTDQITSSQPQLKNFTKTNGFLSPTLKKAIVSAYPSQKFNTIVEPKEASPETQRTIKELKDAFECAETSGEMLKLFKQMESSFDEEQLALPCLKLGLYFEEEGKDPENTLNFALRAYNVFDKDGKFSDPLVLSLQLLGSACYKLKKFDDSLNYLNKAKIMLEELLYVDGIKCKDFYRHEVHLSLVYTYLALGQEEIAIKNLWRCMHIAILYDYGYEGSFFGTTLYLLKRTQPLLEKFCRREERVKHNGGRIGNLLMKLGKPKEAITYLEDAVDSLHKSLGPDCRVGYKYEDLGQAYLETGRYEEAALALEIAKNMIITVACCHNLAKAYHALGRYTLAIELEESVVEAYKETILALTEEGNGRVKPAVQAYKPFLRVAEQVLEELKKKDAGVLPDPGEERHINYSGYAPQDRTMPPVIFSKYRSQLVGNH